MENQEMYKLGFELALKEAGLVDATKRFGQTMWEETPNLRGLIGLGNDATVAARGVKPIVGKAYKRTPADIARRQKILANQPKGAFGVGARAPSRA